MKTDLPDVVIEAMGKCALRFDGYRWLAEARGDSDLNFQPWVAPVVDTLTFHADEFANFSVFFALQRFLGKWGGEQLPQTDPHHTAFCYLFLHLHPLPVPRAYQNNESWAAGWNDILPERRQLYAAMVRRALLSPARRKEFDPDRTPSS